MGGGEERGGGGKDGGRGERCTLFVGNLPGGWTSDPTVANCWQAVLFLLTPSEELQAMGEFLHL